MPLRARRPGPVAAAAARVGWSGSEVARRLGVSGTSWVRMCDPTLTPEPAVVAYLERVAAAIEAIPVPRCELRQGSPLPARPGVITAMARRVLPPRPRNNGHNSWPPEHDAMLLAAMRRGLRDCEIVGEVKERLPRSQAAIQSRIQILRKRPVEGRAGDEENVPTEIGAARLASGHIQVTAR
jgi:hypothetical protein